jgi:hypothetical protein
VKALFVVHVLQLHSSHTARRDRFGTPLRALQYF